MRERTIAQLADFLDGRCLAVLATLRPDGAPLLSPVWYEFREGVFQVVVNVGDVKDRHLARDPRVSLVVAEQAFPYRGLEVLGRAELTTDGAAEATTRMAHRYLSESAARSYLTKVSQQPGRLVLIRPQRTRAWDFLDFKATV